MGERYGISYCLSGLLLPRLFFYLCTGPQNNIFLCLKYTNFFSPFQFYISCRWLWFFFVFCLGVGEGCVFLVWFTTQSMYVFWSFKQIISFSNTVMIKILHLVGLNPFVFDTQYKTQIRWSRQRLAHTPSHIHVCNLLLPSSVNTYFQQKPALQA